MHATNRRARRSAIILISALIIFLGRSAGAETVAGKPEDKAAFTVLSIKDGLPSSSVSAVIQDSKGFMWFGTQGGLCRYDGSGFKSFENQPFDENSLSGDLIQTLFKDKDDTFWIGTYNGLNRFDSDSELFTHYRYSPDKDASLSNDLVIAIARDARGSLWVGTLNGLNRLDEKTGLFTRYFHADDNPHSIPNNVIRSLFLDSRGRFWIGTTGGGLASYDYDADRFDNRVAVGGKPPVFADKAPARASLAGYPTSLSTQSIAEDGDGNLWIGAWGRGLVKYSPNADRSVVFDLPDNRIYVVNTADPAVIHVGTWGGGLYDLDTASGNIEGYKSSLAVGALPNDVVYSILVDASRELWVGTNGGGVARLDKTRKSFTAYVAEPENPHSLPNGKILSSLVDRQGRLWVSVYSNGIQRLDADTGRWRHFRHSGKDPRSIPDDTCNTIYMDRDGALWFCTNSGLSRWNPATEDFTTWNHEEGNPDSLSSGIIYSILEDPDGNMWVGTYTTGLDFWDRKTGSFRHYPFSPGDPWSISDNLVNSLVFDAAGRLWVGTNNGLNRFEGGRFVRYVYAPGNSKGLASSSIFRVIVDTRGVLWVATRGGGLNRYDPATDSFTHLMKKDGLPSNIIYTALEDKTGNLWVVTQTGIALYDRQEGTLKRITLYKELDNASFTSGSSTGPGGELYFGSMGLLVKFDPDHYEHNAHIPPVFITDLRTANNSKLVSPTSRPTALPIRLANWENSLEIRFAALDYRDPTGNQFAYRLEGFDKDWTFSSTRNFATYTNLPGGRYVFRVKAANNDGTWNETGAYLPFSVATPPFLSPLAMVLYLLALILLGYSLASIRSNRVLALKVRELTEADKALTLANTEARRLAMEADSANKAKSEFIATMSHEIRTPIHGVVGMAEVLSRTKLDRAQSEDVATIRKSGESLLELINGILDFSKIEARKVTLEDIPFDLGRMVADTQGFFARPAEEKGIRFEAFFDEGLPRIVRGDPLRLRQILFNLAGNAVKFTHKGSVRVFVERAEPGDGPAIRDGKAAIRFRVVDTGIGITLEEQAVLFKPFTQADQSTTRRYGGTGLGLSISERYVDLMGGVLGLESRRGEGSTFAFTLTLAVANDDELALRESAGSTRDSLVGARILVVDDDEVNRRVALSFLAELGAESFDVDSGPAAIVELGRHRYDLVILDCMMPGMDGFETTRRLRDGTSGALDPSLPIVAMTARAEPEDKVHCLEAGMDDYLLKPFSIAVLEETIAGVLGRAASAGRRPGARLEPSASTSLQGASPSSRTGRMAPTFNEADFKSRYEGSPALAKEILGLFLGQTRIQFEEALAAPAEGRSFVIAEVMHRIKGSGGAVAALRLSWMASEIEDALRAKNGGSSAEAGKAPLIEGLLETFDEELARLETELRAYLARLDAEAPGS